jgi:hypothetical protein
VLDLVLLFVAALCQLALGFLGFRASVPPPKWTFVLVGLVGVGAIVWSGYRSGNVQGLIADGVQKIQQKLQITASSDETEVYFQCDWTPMPKLMPASGEINVFEPSAGDPLGALKTFGGANLGKQFGPPGGELRWSNDGKAFVDGHKCQLFNYGNGPLFDIVLTFDVALREVVKNVGGGESTGKILENGKWIADIPKLDEGRTNPFEFYFFNRFWPYFIQIDPTPSATFIRSNDAARQTVNVISSAHNQPIFLNPAEIKQ